jgi:hypothetical protein
MYFTILDVFSPVQGILAVNEVDTLSTSMRHRTKEESFYLKIVPVPCYSTVLRVHYRCSVPPLECRIEDTQNDKVEPGTSNTMSLSVFMSDVPSSLPHT